VKFEGRRELEQTLRTRSKAECIGLAGVAKNREEVLYRGDHHPNDHGDVWPEKVL